ncbi:MAG: rod shape-determining protein MreD [Eubacteriales bacterium]|nr:rod shape-determining protein MreD [Eubacteriales bacterium]
MKNKCILFLTAVVCFFLQSTLLQKIAIGSISPNLLVIFVVSVGLMRGNKTAMFVGFFTGLLDDLCFGGAVGLNAFLYMAIGYLCGFSCKIYYDNNIKVPVILVALNDLIYNMGIFVFTFLLRGRIHFLFFLERIIIPELIYTILLTVIAYKIFYFINYRFMEQDRKEGNTNWLLR